MRRGHKNQWLVNEKSGQLMGISLGSDFVAEHEWGIKDLNTILGIKSDESIVGMDRYKVNIPNAEYVVWRENKDEAILVITHYSHYKTEPDFNKMANGELKIWDKEEMATAWDGGSLGIHVKGEKNVKKLVLIRIALLEGKAAVWLGGQGIFNNGGLIVGIIDNIPEENKKQMANAHVDKKKLKEASDATGIKQKIDALNGKWHQDNPGNYSSPTLGYFALSPSWKKQERNSKHPVVYWLNPMNQDRTNYGWFTVEDLEQWIEGKGPIPMSKKEKVKNV